MMRTRLNENESPIILLVEDDAADALLTQRALTKADARVTLIRVENGDEAVAYLEGSAPYQERSKHPMPDLLLLDIKLPRRSGLEVLEWVRSQEEDDVKLLPVVMLTSSRHRKDVHRAYEKGANSYLTKPDSNADLVELLRATQDYWLRHNEPIPPKQDT